MGLLEARESGVELPIHERRMIQLRPFVVPGEPQYYFDHSKFLKDRNYQPNANVVEELRKREAPEDDISRVFTPDGRIIPRSYVDYDINIDEMGVKRDANDVLNYLRGTLEEPLRLIDPSLRDEELRQKNNHGPEHGRIVAQIEDSLLKQTGLSDPRTDIRRAGVVAGYMHDIGAIFGDAPHPYFSRMTWREFLPHLKMTHEQERLIDNALMFHDTETISEVFEEAKTSSLKKYVKIRQSHGEIASAVTMADKFDLGSWRLPKNAPAHDIDNPHRLINLYGKTEKAAYSDDLTRFEWNIDFGSKLPEDALTRFPQFAIRDKDGKIVPRPGNLLRTSDFDQWESLYWTLYYPRTMMVVIDAFALNPLLEEVVITMTDKSGPFEGAVKPFRFPKEVVAERMKYYFETRVPEAKKGKWEYQMFANLEDDLAA